MGKRASYWEYIRVEDLLGLQNGIASSETELADDEVRFIVIHQIDELWFKLVLRELVTARDLFRLEYVPETSLSAAHAALHRVAMIFGLASDHFRLMETMRPRDYLRFRDKLAPASGFQSAQMREIEILLGLEERERLRYGHEASFKDALRGDAGAASPALQRVERRITDVPSLKDAVYSWLARTPIHGSTPEQKGDAETVRNFVAGFLEGHAQAMRKAITSIADSQALAAGDRERLEARYREQLGAAKDFLAAADVEQPAAAAQARRIRAAVLFIDSHRELPLLAWPGEILDGVIELEQSMLIFRQRHARMVERIIGRRIGTGGSDGVDYLDRTALTYRVFKEVWAARTLLLDPALAPPVPEAGFYGFRDAR